MKGKAFQNLESRGCVSEYTKTKLASIKIKQEPIVEETKKCKSCSQEWVLEEYKNGSLVCRTCLNARARARRPRKVKVKSHTKEEANTFNKILSMKW